MAGQRLTLCASFQWTQLKIRKQNLTRLFEKMQAYQYEQISADPDKPLADGIRALDTTDMERYSLPSEAWQPLASTPNPKHPVFPTKLRSKDLKRQDCRPRGFEPTDDGTAQVESYLRSKRGLWAMTVWK